MQGKSHQKGSRRRMNGFEEWGGYMAAKKTKLNLQFEEQKHHEIAIGQSISNIFQGISIFVDGYTKPSADELKRLMMLHGGTYHYYYSASYTTHMIASNLADSKIKSLKNRKVVTPDWITDSIKAGKLLPYYNYLLYTPETTSRQHRLELKQNVQKLCFPMAESVSPYSFNNNIGENLVETPKNNLENNSLVLQDVLTTDVLKCSKPGSIHDGISLTNFSPANVTVESRNKTKSGRAMKAGNPDFISEFYSHSRLHHISTAVQYLKQYVQQLAAMQKEKPYSGRDELLSMKKAPLETQWYKHEKVIMHLDMDCFFVSVGLRKYPELRGYPVAVTHSKGKRNKPQDGSSLEYELSYYMKRQTDNFSFDVSDEEEMPNDKQGKTSLCSAEYGSLSEIACCNYEARQASIRNGMFLGKAMKLCPGLKTIPYDFESYFEVSKQLCDIVASFTSDIEVVSCDELYIDCSDILRETGTTPSEFASFLRHQIYQKTGCTASAGVGSNKLLARLATRVAKPNGQFIVDDSQVMNFIQNQKVQDLPGVGFSTASKLEQFGVYTCGDLQKWPLSKLQQEFGSKTGQTLYDHCRGQDDKVVTLEKDRKSVSADINYGIRFEKEKDIYDFLNELAVEVQQRLKRIKKKGRRVTLKLMVRKHDAPMETAKFMGHGVCDSFSKSTLLRIATDDSKVIANECYTMSQTFKISPQDYRGVGIQIGKLESSECHLKTIDTFLSKPCSSTPEKVQSIFSQEKRSFEKQSSEVNALKSPAKDTTITKFLCKSPATKIAPVSPYNDVLLEGLDQSVLNALPEDVRQEILSSCAVRPKVPSNNSSPTKSVLASNRNQKKLLSPKSKRSKSFKSGLQSVSRYWEKSCRPMVSDSNSNVVLPSNFSSTHASLGGAVHIDEVRDLLKEWVETTRNPGDDEIEELRTYLFQLIEENLEKADLILKYFYRITGSAGELWRESYIFILSCVQQKMLQEFGYMLKARSDFSSI